MISLSILRIRPGISRPQGLKGQIHKLIRMRYSLIRIYKLLIMGTLKVNSESLILFKVDLIFSKVLLKYELYYFSKINFITILQFIYF